MSLSINQTNVKFLHKSLSVIKGEPDYQIFHDRQNLIYSNASDLVTTMGGGKHSHIVVVVQYMLYAKSLSTPYSSPIDPEVIATFPADTTTATLLHIRGENTKSWHI